MKAKDDWTTDHLVGIDDQVEAIMDLLDYDFGGARCLGIHGPAGIGKTTLAKALFDKLIENFDQNCFLRDVHGSSRCHGLVFLQKKLLLGILGKTKPVDINDIDDIMPIVDIDDGVSINDINHTDDGMKVIREKLIDKKVLIVLDDVDCREQLEKLIGKINWFDIGSRVIITTRNKSIIESGEKIILYELKEMNYDQALQLYTSHALNRESPRDNYCNKLSRDIVSTIGGLPLIIKVIGSFLHGKHETIWNDTLEKLRSIAPKDVYQMLKISYDALNFRQKQIFLDIACFSFHEEEINASYIWEDCNFPPQLGNKRRSFLSIFSNIAKAIPLLKKTGVEDSISCPNVQAIPIEIEILSSLSLIHIRENGKLWMHDVLKDLGRQIVLEENLDSGKRSRLWISEEAVDMVKTRENKGNIEALSLTGDPTLLILTDEDFARLPNLRFLKLDGGSFIGDFTNLFSKLRWISWCHFPPDLTAINLFPQNLIVLQLSEFNDATNWDGWSQIKMLHNLKVLQLTCLNMVRIDLSGCFAMERLIIEECRQLLQIDRSIGELKQLAYLNIEGCCKLNDLPGEIGLLVNLTHLSLSNCSALTELPGSTGMLNSLIKLDLSFTSIELLPYSVGCLGSLKFLSLAGCREIRELPNSIGNLKSLIELDLSLSRIEVFPSIGLGMKLEVIRATRCSEVYEVSREIGKLSFLRILDLSHTPIFLVPETIGALSHLEELILRDCDELQVLPSLPPSLTHLHVSSQSLHSIPNLSLPPSLTHLHVSSQSLHSIPNLSNLTNLVDLSLSDGGLRSSSLIDTIYLEWVGKLSKLRNLELCFANFTVSPTALGSLSRLRKLCMSGNRHPEVFMQPPKPAMQKNPSSITTFPGLSNLRYLLILKLCRSQEKEIQLGRLELLRHLNVSGFQFLETIKFSLSGLKNLKELELHDCPMLIEIHGLWALETLESLKVDICPSIKRLSDLSRLQKLLELKIAYCDDLRVCKGLNKLGCLSLFKVISCPYLGFWTNASTTKIPNECRIIIEHSPRLGKTPQGGVFYKDYRRFKSGSDTHKFDKKDKVERCSEMSPITELELSDHEGEEDPSISVINQANKDKLTYQYNKSIEVARCDELGSITDLESSGNEGEEDPSMSVIIQENEVAEMEEKSHVARIERGARKDDQANHILSLMNISDNDKRIIVIINGEGGIGKTTLAKLIYNQVSCHFDGCSFLANINEATQVLGGFQLLQTKLISDVLKRELEDVAFVSRGIEFFRDSFCNMRVLIILDDVENAFHVQKLIGDCFDCFASGSRILVTTRNSVVLEESPQIRTYYVSRLDNDQAFQLFRQHASLPTSSSCSNFELLNRHLKTMAGLPLFIEVMGALSNIKTPWEWSMLLQEFIIPKGDFQSIVEGGLDHEQKQRFLDIACFATGIDSRVAFYLWFDSTFLPSSEILTPLAKIGENNQIWMHSMLRRLGREIIRGENLTDPGRRSRILNHEIALDTIKRKQGTEKVEALCLNFQWHPSVKLTPEDFDSMPNIRFLQLDHADIAGDFANVFPNLKWLRWRGCPRHIKVTSFHLGNLTILDLSWSKVTKEWEGWDQIEMRNLRVLDLTGCADLLVTPKFSGCKNLAMLILERCSQLVKIDYTIGKLKCLVSLNLKFCIELSMLPVEVGQLTALKELLMDGTLVQEVPISIGHLKQLETLSASNCFSLSRLPRTICHLIDVSLLLLDGSRITALPDSVRELIKLKHLSLRDCRQIRKLPNSIGNIGRSLVELDVSGTGIVKFPDSLKSLKNLKVLRMDSCFFREFPPDIGELTSLEEIHACCCRSLKGGIPSEIAKLHNLRILRLRRSTISSIPEEIHQLFNLRTLDLLHCDMIKELPRLPSSITVLYVDDELKSSHLP